MPSRLRRFLASTAALGIGTAVVGMTMAGANGPGRHGASATTPIQHVVVIFQENVSFDHYFGTYPNADNTSGQPFHARPGTPTVNGLTDSLLNNNPNLVNPRRYDPANVNDILTCDQDHDYTAEQKAFDGGAMDNFPATVGNNSGFNATKQVACNKNDVMNYYDGNTTTALWNYAQNFAMSDNSFGTNFGPSSPGAINLVSGNTGTVGATTGNVSGDVVSNGQNGLSLISDAQPYTTTVTAGRPFK